MKQIVRAKDLKIGDEVYVDTVNRATVTVLSGRCAHVKSDNGNIDRNIGVTAGELWDDGNRGNLLREITAMPKYILIYDKPSKQDPTEFYTTKEDLDARLTELLSNNLIIPNSVRIYTVSKEQTIKYSITMIDTVESKAISLKKAKQK
jgi:hypothetical protein